jgi:putative transposase
MRPAGSLNVSIKQRLYPEPEHMDMLRVHCGHARFIWNLALEQRQMYRKDRDFKPSMVSQAKELADLRKELDWLRAGASTVQQQALRDLDRAYQNWWSNPKHFSPPKNRSIKDRSQGFYVRDLSLTRLNNKWATVFLPKIGPVKFRLTRSWAEIKACKSARVRVTKSGQWHVSFTCSPPVFERENTGVILGIDRGVTHTIATSEGRFAKIPSLTGGEIKRFLALEQQFSRQVKGTKSREQTRVKLAKLREKLSRRRQDWVEQTTTKLVRENDVLVLEKLQIRNMVKAPAHNPDPEREGQYLPNGARAKAGLSRAIHASCWGLFLQRLQDKASMTPETDKTRVVLVDPRNTSRECNSCGHTAPENRESQAVFACVKCGHTANADTNAAQNILDRGIMSKALLPPDGRSMDAVVPSRALRLQRVKHQVLTSV